MADMENKTDGQAYRYAKDLSSVTNFLRIMLWVSLGVSILALVSDFMQMRLLEAGMFTQAEAAANDSRQQIVGILYLAVFVATGFVFLKWIYRCNANCHGFGAQGMKFTPGWSIGYYFIPFLNLYKPYQSMKEIWKVSTNPSDWNNAEGASLLGIWWALWLISGFAGHISFRMALQADSISALQSSTGASIVSEFIDIPLILVAISLVSAIFAKQETLVGKAFHRGVS